MASELTPPITRLPTELLCAVFANLSPATVKTARHVCRAFNDCLWPAFGASLRDNTFDLRSLRSWNNFLELSRHSRMSQYVTRLRFGCGFLAESFPGPQEPAPAEDDDFDEVKDLLEPEEYLLPDTLRELEQIRKAELIAYPQIWSVSGEETMRHLNKSLAVETLTSILSRFTNLRAVCFANVILPVVFRDIYDKIVDNGLIAFEDSEAGLGKHELLDAIAVEVLLCALAKCSMAVRTLTLPLRRLNHQMFATYASPDILDMVLAKVETLKVIVTVTSESLRCGGHTLPLPNLNAPILRHLVLSSWHCSSPWSYPGQYDFHISSTPFPALTHLEIEWLQDELDQCFYDFVDGVGSSLKNLTVHHLVHYHELGGTEGSPRLLEFLRGSAVYLDTLHVGHIQDKWGMNFTIPSQSLDGIARNVVLPRALSTTLGER